MTPTRLIAASLAATLLAAAPAAAGDFDAGKTSDEGHGVQLVAGDIEPSAPEILAIVPDAAGGIWIFAQDSDGRLFQRSCANSQPADCAPWAAVGIDWDRRLTGNRFGGYRGMDFPAARQSE